MRLCLLAGRSNPELAMAIASSLGVELSKCTIEDFPDEELNVVVGDDVQGCDVFVIQSTNPPIGDNLLELLLLADAARRAGAERITAVVPYFGYARQDRRQRSGEPVGARVLADLLCTRVDRLVAVDLHNPAIEGFLTIPVEHVSAVPQLAATIRSWIDKKSVFVAPDLGAVKLAQRYADRLGLPVAYVHKERVSGRDVQVRHIIGKVRDRFPVVVDDMISTGGTMVSSVKALLEKGCRQPVSIVATHAVLTKEAISNLASLPMARIVVTDTIYRSADINLPIERVSIRQELAHTIRRMNLQVG